MYLHNHCVYIVVVPGGSDSPVICGMNTGQHMYVDSSPECIKMNFLLGEGKQIVLEQRSRVHIRHLPEGY